MFKNKGFSLLELLIASIILGILFFTFSIQIYSSYKKKAYVATLINNVRACFYEIMDFCESHFNGRIVLSNFQACNVQHSIYGDVVFSLEGGNSCNGNSLPEGFKVKGKFLNLNYEYLSVCEFVNQGVRCYIDYQN